jgi:hypothetical protein
MIGMIQALQSLLTFQWPIMEEFRTFKHGALHGFLSGLF